MTSRVVLVPGGGTGIGFLGLLAITVLAIVNFDIVAGPNRWSSG